MKHIFFNILRTLVIVWFFWWLVGLLVEVGGCYIHRERTKYKQDLRKSRKKAIDFTETDVILVIEPLVPPYQGNFQRNCVSPNKLTISHILSAPSAITP